MGGFRCNICGSRNPPLAEPGDRERVSCVKCGSTIRTRAVMLALARGLFGFDLAMPDFPRLKSLRGLGFSDVAHYADELERTFSYLNTQYDREPRFDLLNAAEGHSGCYDFVICSEVLEHVAPPVEVAFAALARLLKPTGVLVLSVPYVPMDATIEHFPTIRDCGFAEVEGRMVMVARTAAGYAVRDDIVFHGGRGSTLERRIFAEGDLRARLAAAGFAEVRIEARPAPEFGVEYRSEGSLPIVAGKAPFTLNGSAVRELVERMVSERRNVRESRWVRLGKRLGLGPQAV